MSYRHKDELIELRLNTLCAHDQTLSAREISRSRTRWRFGPGGCRCRWVSSIKTSTPTIAKLLFLANGRHDVTAGLSTERWGQGYVRHAELPRGRSSCLWPGLCWFLKLRIKGHRKLPVLILGRHVDAPPPSQPLSPFPLPSQPLHRSGFRQARPYRDLETRMFCQWWGSTRRHVFRWQNVQESGLSEAIAGLQSGCTNND